MSCRHNSIINSFHQINSSLDSINTIRISETKLVPTRKFILTVDSIKSEFVKESGGWDENNGEHHSDGNWTSGKGTLNDDANLQASSQIMIERKQGKYLFNLIEQTREQLLSLIRDSIKRRELAEQIPLRITPDGIDDSTWTANDFESIPVIAAITLLTKFENDALNSEVLIVNYLNMETDRKSIDSLTKR